MTTDRRAFILGAGALIVGACTSDADVADTVAEDADASTSSATTHLDDSSSVSTPETTAASNGDTEADLLTPEMFAALPTCILTQPAGEGPFPTQAPILRREIHENYPGHPLRLGLRVVDAGCLPVAGATVDIWHTDASGDYSEYTDNASGKDEGDGSTFCRGAQVSDSNGILEFLTIYPGWYDGRTVHIHATVRIDDARVLTTQLYLDESLTAAVHEVGEYAQFGPQDTSWARDGLAGDPSSNGSLMVTSPSETVLGSGTLALINLGVEIA